MCPAWWHPRKSQRTPLCVCNKSITSCSELCQQLTHKKKPSVLPALHAPAGCCWRAPTGISITGPPAPQNTPGAIY